VGAALPILLAIAQQQQLFDFGTTIEPENLVVMSASSAIIAAYFAITSEGPGPMTRKVGDLAWKTATKTKLTLEKIEDKTGVVASAKETLFGTISKLMVTAIVATEEAPTTTASISSSSTTTAVDDLDVKIDEVVNDVQEALKQAEAKLEEAKEIENAEIIQEDKDEQDEEEDSVQDVTDEQDEEENLVQDIIDEHDEEENLVQDVIAEQDEEENLVQDAIDEQDDSIQDVTSSSKDAIEEKQVDGGTFSRGLVSGPAFVAPETFDFGLKEQDEEDLSAAAIQALLDEEATLAEEAAKRAEEEAQAAAKDLAEEEERLAQAERAQQKALAERLADEAEKEKQDHEEVFLEDEEGSVDWENIDNLTNEEEEFTTVEDTLLEAEAEEETVEIFQDDGDGIEEVEAQQQDNTQADDDETDKDNEEVFFDMDDWEKSIRLAQELDGEKMAVTSFDSDDKSQWERAGRLAQELALKDEKESIDDVTDEEDKSVDEDEDNSVINFGLLEEELGRAAVEKIEMEKKQKRKEVNERRQQWETEMYITDKNESIETDDEEDDDDDDVDLEALAAAARAAVDTFESEKENESGPMEEDGEVYEDDDDDNVDFEALAAAARAAVDTFESEKENESGPMEEDGEVYEDDDDDNVDFEALAAAARAAVDTFESEKEKESNSIEEDDEDVDFEALAAAARAAVDQFQSGDEEEFDLQSEFQLEPERWQAEGADVVDTIQSNSGGTLEEEEDEEEFKFDVELEVKETLGAAARGAVNAFESAEEGWDEPSASFADGSVSNPFKVGVEDTGDTVTDWSKFKVVDLKAELKSRGLPTTGKKADLVAALTKADLELTLNMFNGGGGGDDDDDEIDYDEVAKRLIEETNTLDDIEEPSVEELAEMAKEAAELYNSDDMSDENIDFDSLFDGIFDDMDDAKIPFADTGVIEEAVGEDNRSPPAEEKDYRSMTIAELKDELRNRGLKLGGKKAELIERLLQSS